MKKIFIFAAILLLFIGCSSPTNTPTTNTPTTNNEIKDFYSNYIKTAYTGSARFIYSDNTVEEKEVVLSFLDVSEQYDFQNRNNVYAPVYAMVFVSHNEFYGISFCEKTQAMYTDPQSQNIMPIEVYLYKTDGLSLHLRDYLR